MQGTVKWFNGKIGYGFIAGLDGLDYFVHWTAICMDGRKELFPMQKVSFEPSSSKKGLMAINVIPDMKIPF